MKIFITGSTGFIGTHLVPRLEREHDVTCMASDLTDHKAVEQEVMDANPDIVVHLAARTEVEESFYAPASFSDVNYVGTVNLIEAAKSLPNLQNFVFASTMEVYGWQPRDIRVFDESTKPYPNAPYAVAKYACEKYLEYVGRAYGMNSTILRQTNTYGRKDNDFFVTEQIISQMLNNPLYIKLGNPHPARNFLYIDDLIDVWEIVINKQHHVPAQLYCLGPENAITISDYVNMIAFKLKWKGEVIWYQKPERPGEIDLLNSSAAKIRRELYWSPKVNLSDGLDLTIQTWREKLNLT